MPRLYLEEKYILSQAKVHDISKEKAFSFKGKPVLTANTCFQIITQCPPVGMSVVMILVSIQFHTMLMHYQIKWKQNCYQETGKNFQKVFASEKEKEKEKKMFNLDFLSFFFMKLRSLKDFLFTVRFHFLKKHFEECKLI